MEPTSSYIMMSSISEGTSLLSRPARSYIHAFSSSDSSRNAAKISILAASKGMRRLCSISLSRLSEMPNCLDTSLMVSSRGSSRRFFLI